MDNVSKQAVLAACPLFSGLEDDALRRLGAAAREVQVAAGYMLLHKGQLNPGLQVIARGAAKLYLSSVAGKELCIAVVGRSSVLDGIGPLFNSEALIHAVATESCTVLILPTAALNQIMGSEQRQGAALRQFSTQLRLLMSVLEDVALHSLDVRVARVLHRLHVQSGRDAAARLHRLDQSLLSNMANGSRSRVNEQLQVLRRLGAIDIQGGAVVVRRPDLLVHAMGHMPLSESVP